MAQWDAELEVDRDALWLAAGSPRAWRLLASGWDCDAWLADELVIWRVPRRHLGEAALRREAALLPVIASRLPVMVPVPVLVRWDGLPLLARHDMVPGRELAVVAPAGPGVGAALGRFLRALHSPELAAAAAGLVPVDPLCRATFARPAAFARKRLDDLAARLDVVPLRAIVDAAEGAAPRVEVLCHGDLHVRHVILDAAGDMSGIIDWGDSCIGARAMDLAIVTALEPASRAEFAREYGPVDEADWRHARMLGVTLATALLVSAPDDEVAAGARRWLEVLAP